MQAKRFPDVHARLEHLSKMALQFVLAFVFPTGEENQNSFTSQEEESDKNRSKHVPLALHYHPGPFVLLHLVLVLCTVFPGRCLDMSFDNQL